MENEIKPAKRVKTDETAEQPVKTKETEAPKEKSRKEALADAAAKAMEALKAMKSKQNDNTVKEKVKFAGGSYQIEREKTALDFRKEENLKKRQLKEMDLGWELDMAVTIVLNKSKLLFLLFI